MYVHISSSVKEKDYRGEQRIALKDLQLTVIDYRFTIWKSADSFTRKRVEILHSFALTAIILHLMQRIGVII